MVFYFELDYQLQQKYDSSWNNYYPCVPTLFRQRRKTNARNRQSSSRPKDLDEGGTVVAHGARGEVVTALETAHLVTTGRGHAINLSIVADDAGIAVDAAARRRLAPHALIHEDVIGPQAAGFGKVIKAGVVPASRARRIEPSRRLANALGKSMESCLQGGQCCW